MLASVWRQDAAWYIRLWDVSGIQDTPPSEPAIYAIAPPANLALPADTTTVRAHVFMYNYDGPWQWQMDAPFPESGAAGGNAVSEGTSVVVDGLASEESNTFYAALVDDAGVLLEPSVTSSVTFSVAVPVPTRRYQYSLPAGLSIFSPALRPLVLEGPFGTIDTRPDGVLMAHHLVGAGATVVVRMGDGSP